MRRNTEGAACHGGIEQKATAINMQGQQQSS
jgi:hypothetical protein